MKENIEHNDIAFVYNVRTQHDVDGQLEESDSAIEVKIQYRKALIEYFDPEQIENEDELEELQEDFEPGDELYTEFLDEFDAFARLRFRVANNVAQLSAFKDADPEDAGWISIEFLRVLDAASRVVENLDGVDHVEPPKDSLVAQVGMGEDAEIHPG